MSLERNVFAPIERLATALYPRRSRIALFASAFVVAAIVTIFVAQLTWPWPRAALSIPRLVTFVGVAGASACFAAILLAGWFCPSSRWFMHAPTRSSRLLNGCLILARSWAVLVLSLLAVAPLLVLVVPLLGL